MGAERRKGESRVARWNTFIAILDMASKFLVKNFANKVKKTF